MPSVFENSTFDLKQNGCYEKKVAVFVAIFIFAMLYGIYQMYINVVNAERENKNKFGRWDTPNKKMSQRGFKYRVTS